MSYTFDAPDYGLHCCHDSRGRLVIADSHAVYLYDGHTVSKVADGFNLIKHLFIDRWNRLWIATYQGLYCYFMMDFHNERLTDSNDLARALAYDGAGHRVAGTLNGKLLIDGKVMAEHPEDFFIPSSAIIDGKVYIGGKEDIYRVEDNRLIGLGLSFDRCQFVTNAFD
jgi:ligand-binding sensor domain-containing protein